MLATMLAGKRVRGRSHVPREARRNKLERHYGITGNFIWLLALVYSVFLPLQVGTLWFYCGLSVFILGSILMAAATFNFITATPDQSITRGSYSFSRHPMYLATFFICLGSGIAAASWLFIFLSLILALCLYQEALIEERYCLEKYGSTYQAYIDRTPRWISVAKKSNR